MHSKTWAIAASLAGTVMLGAVAPAHAVIVAANGNASALVAALLGNGITLVPNSATYTGGAQASGTFTAGGNLGISTGILLTNGSVNNAPGPNNTTGASTNNGLAGDARLTALANQTTFDASVLTFSFTSTTNALSFNYVFASEEYPEFVNSFNDVFAFFLDGVNIALIPNTNTAVSINNVNANVNSQYYRNNNFQNGTAPFDTQYDGLTTVLTAGVTNLSAGVHTISLAIADAGDGNLDSGVFLAGGSFTAAPPTTTVPEPSALVLLGGGLVAAALARRRKDRR